MDRKQLGSTLDEKNFVYDSSGIRCYRATCNGCNSDRGYVRKTARHKMCMSCGQKGKVSSRKGKHHSEEAKKLISAANQRRNLQNDLSYVKRTPDQERVIHSLRSRVSQLITKKNSKTLELLGCTWTEFYAYIASLFEVGMTWANYGRKGWHLDHKVPLSSFDLSIPEQLKVACHYTNLQPLWWIDNLRKSNKVDL